MALEFRKPALTLAAATVAAALLLELWVPRSVNVHVFYVLPILFTWLFPSVASTVLATGASIVLAAMGLWVGAGPVTAAVVADHLLAFLLFVAVGAIVTRAKQLRRDREASLKMLQASQERLDADLKAMARLHELSLLSAQLDDLPSVLGAIVEAAVDLGGADFGDIQLLEPVSDHMKIAVSRGLPDWWLAFWNRTAAAGHGTCGRAAQRREQVVVEDVARSSVFVGTPALDVQLRAGIRAVHSSPIISRSGTLLGVLSTHFKTPQCFDARRLQLNNVLAQQAAGLIEHARADAELRSARDRLEHRVDERTAELADRARQLLRLSSELVLVEQRAKEALARLLHDGVQQLLFGARLRIDRLCRILPADSVSEELAAVRGNLTEAIGAVRSLSLDLCPPVLREGTFADCLSWLCLRTTEKYGLEVRSSLDTTVDPTDAEIRLLAFESARELLFNVVKHAPGATASVELTAAGPDHFRLTVADDGPGLDAEAATRDGHSNTNAGFGLFSMRERLTLLGGCLEIQSRPGEGCRFTMLAPRRSTPELPGVGSGVPPSLLGETPASSSSVVGSLPATRPSEVTTGRVSEPQRSAPQRNAPQMSDLP